MKEEIVEFLSVVSLILLGFSVWVWYEQEDTRVVYESRYKHACHYHLSDGTTIQDPNCSLKVGQVVKTK